MFSALQIRDFRVLWFGTLLSFVAFFMAMIVQSVVAFEIAGRQAMREALAKAGAQLLEPIMKVEVTTPEEYQGSIMGDLNSRRGQIVGTDRRGNAVVITAMVPLANMFGYVDTLRSMSQGRANFTMIFDHYAPVPKNVADEIIAKVA